MKQFRFILRLVGTLFLITAVVAGLLAGVNAITETRIADAKAEKVSAAIRQVLPGAGEFSPASFSDETGTVKNVYLDASGSGSYAVEVEPSGFGGPVTMMVGVDSSGAVIGISVISHTETAGLGAVAGADTSAGHAFRESFSGLKAPVSVSKDGGQADTLTGATITSRAVAAGVQAALECRVSK